MTDRVGLRLSRYEVTLWRQARQILLALDALDRRKPQERTRFGVDNVIASTVVAD